MADISTSKKTDKLKKIKDQVRNAWNYFRGNYTRYNEFRRFVFESSMSPDDISLLKELQKPQLEFNILEAFVSRLRGEFSKQEPSISIRASDGAKADPMIIQLVEAHMKAALFDTANDMLEYDVYTDLLSGGFSCLKVTTDYQNPMSFDQNIFIKRVFDPTLCGFDPLARLSHKGDGKFCFELFPMLKEDFEDKYGDEYTRNVKFIRNVEGFNWTYQNGLENIILVCDFYEKKKERVRIVKLTNGQTIPMREYNDLLAWWQENGLIEQPPAIVGKPRTTEMETIHRTRFIEDHILEEEETDYKYLPIVFVDGNSVHIRNGVNGAEMQLTRPYVYHARGLQKLKNFAGQCLANELENMIMHKWKVPKDGIPPEYQEAYANVQKANVLIYNAFKDNDPNVPLPPPQEIVRAPAPPEITNTFRLTDEMTQTILGSYDASLGINDNQLSGVAIVEGATQSNSAAMPYIVGFMKGLNRAAEIYVDLMPKYFVTPRTLPIMNKQGKREYVRINGENEIKLNYDANDLDVNVEAGVNFSIQKAKERMAIIEMMRASPIFAQFINSEGLATLLDTLEIRGIDQLKESAQQFQQQFQQQLKQQQEQQMMKMQLAKQKMQMEGQDMQMKGQMHQSQLAVDIAKLRNDQMKIMSDLKQSKDETAVQKLKAETERFAKSVDLELKHRDQLHGHHMDHLTHQLETKKHEQSSTDAG